MKIIYILFVVILFQASSIQAQPNQGQFEIRISSGATANELRVQYRAIGSVVPTVDNICPDLTFKLWWNVSGVGDIDVIQTSSLNGQINESTNPTGGTNTGNAGGTSGTVVAAGVVGDPFFFPNSWVLNQWVTVANVTICSNNNCNPPGSPAGVTFADFQIQGYVSATGSPNINVDGEDYAPTAGTLPLNLISFRASKSGDKSAQLSWITANEENTSHFLVQRSFDKSTWSNVGTIEAAGYSVDIKNYELLDLNIYDGIASRLQVYYRLVMIDLDGRTKLSPVQSVVFGNSLTSGREILVYPNPASHGVNVQWTTNGLEQPTSLEFYDVSGKLVIKQEVPEKVSEQYVDFTKSTIQPGLYMLRIMSHGIPIEYKQIVVGN